MKEVHLDYRKGRESHCLLILATTQQWTELSFGGVRKPLVLLADAEKEKLLNEPSVKAMHTLLYQ